MRGGGAVYSGARPDQGAAAEAQGGSEPSHVAFQGTGHTLNSGPGGRPAMNASPLAQGQGTGRAARAATLSPTASREEQRARALAAAERRMR